MTLKLTDIKKPKKAKKKAKKATRKPVLVLQTAKTVKLIDALEYALFQAGCEVKRDSWRENVHSEPPKDFCSWLDITLPSRDNKDKKITVHLYFSQDATRLDEVSVWETEFKYVEQETTKLTK